MQNLTLLVICALAGLCVVMGTRSAGVVPFGLKGTKAKKSALFGSLWKRSDKSATSVLKDILDIRGGRYSLIYSFHSTYLSICCRV